MATMKNIDPKSLIIGVLATALVFACTDSNKKNSASPSLVSEAKAATSKDDRGKWDNEQQWVVRTDDALRPNTTGWEPFAINYFRKRIK